MCGTLRRARDLTDVIKWVKFSDLSWSRDGKGFFYSRYDEPMTGNKLAAVNEYHKLYYHRLGTPQAMMRSSFQATTRR